jgi:hypothetical protein
VQPETGPPCGYLSEYARSVRFAARVGIFRTLSAGSRAILKSFPNMKKKNFYPQILTDLHRLLKNKDFRFYLRQSLLICG